MICLQANGRVRAHLCVQGYLDQVQELYSRVRWASSEQCQHVISSDIRPYNKKLLGTSPALQQEVALPAHFILRKISSAAPGFEAAVRLIQGGRRPSTVKSYDDKWFKFEAFTS